MLYTGDFKLGESATAERAELPQAEILVIETTYGTPAIGRCPEPRRSSFAGLVREVLAPRMTPVVQAYVLGKAQEVTQCSPPRASPVLQHPEVYAISQVYRACGVDRGVRALSRPAAHGLCGRRAAAAACPGRLGLKRAVTFAVTGWAMDAKCRLGVDHAIPLSDHADYDELFAAVERVAPRVVYCTHGPESFVDCLREPATTLIRWTVRTCPHSLAATAAAPVQMRMF